MGFFSTMSKKAKGFGQKINSFQDDMEKNKERRIRENYKLEQKRAALRKVEMKTQKLKEMYRPKPKPANDFFNIDQITGLRTGPATRNDKRIRNNCKKVIRPEHKRKRIL